MYIAVVGCMSSLFTGFFSAKRETGHGQSSTRGANPSGYAGSCRCVNARTSSNASAGPTSPVSLTSRFLVRESNSTPVSCYGGVSTGSEGCSCRVVGTTRRESTCRIGNCERKTRKKEFSEVYREISERNSSILTWGYGEIGWNSLVNLERVSRAERFASKMFALADFRVATWLRVQYFYFSIIATKSLKTSSLLAMRISSHAKRELPLVFNTGRTDRFKSLISNSDRVYYFHSLFISSTWIFQQFLS